MVFSYLLRQALKAERRQPVHNWFWVDEGMQAYGSRMMVANAPVMPNAQHPAMTLY